MNPRAFNRLAAVALAVAFVLSLARLVQYRFAAGDIYPPASSLRADPLGTKALREALALLPGLRVERNHESIARLADAGGTTLLLLGVAPDSKASPMLVPADNDALERRVRRGDRLVLAFGHQSMESATNTLRGGFPQFPVLPASTNGPVGFDSRLAFDLSLTNGAGDVARRVGGKGTLPATLPWSSPWSLAGLGPEWHAVYERGGSAVVAERSLGSGTIVIAASDYPFSNAALRRSHEGDFLAWIVGPNRRVVFDETHLGLTIEPGVAALIRKYRLGGAIAGLCLLAVLHAWRESARFNPPPPPADSGILHGRGSAGGLLNILRRAVDPSRLPEVSFDEWRRSLGPRRPLSENRLAAAQELANLESAKPPRERDPADFHRRLARLLRHR